MTTLGAIACGHPQTAAAAETVLREGGNAFDAAVAALFMACVAEPVLASLGGGGFLLARTADGKECVYDFFAQTPRRKRPAEKLEFYPIEADFGPARQEFHIGLGAAATPGAVKGAFAVHRDLCALPMTELVRPAATVAREGVTLSPFQAYLLKVIRPILFSSEAARRLFTTDPEGRRLAQAGEVLRQEQLANTLETLAREGEDVFYQGEIARQVVELCRDGGLLGAEDLAEYRVLRRPPLALRYRDTRILSNPPPSSGGILIGFALKLLEPLDLGAAPFGSGAHLLPLADAMDLSNQARIDLQLDAGRPAALERALDPDFLKRYRAEILKRQRSPRGTTHISVTDAAGNVAALSISNGEGCGHLIPGTGIMLNNMLGEADLNLGGFHRWRPDERMTSMMAPSLVSLPDGRLIALGSGGSNRIRTALLQVMLNLSDFRLPLQDAIDRPRIHCEPGQLHAEPGFDPAVLEQLAQHFPHHKIWRERNLFFGGVHAVMRRGAAAMEGAGDPRRGGCARVVA